MNTLKYEVSKNDSLVRWLITDMKETPFASPKEAFFHPVNMREDYIQVIYPVRKAFLAQNNLTAVERYDGQFDTIYFPLENSRVDRSTFRHTPTVLSFNARSWVQAPKDGSYPFTLYTCGAVKIWVDGIPTLTFAPFTRDVASKTQLSLELTEGKHQIDIFAQELAERDVFFYFELRYLGDKPGLLGLLEIEENPQEIEKAEKLLFSLGFEQDEFSSGSVNLFYDNNAVYKDNLVLTVNSDKRGLFESKDFVLDPKEKVLEIAKVSDCKTGPWGVTAGVKVQNRVVSRYLNLAIKKEAPFKALPNQKERKAQALTFIEENGEDLVNKVLVRIALGLEEPGKLSQKSLECLEPSLQWVESMGDCADFHLAPLLVLVKNHSSYLTNELKKRIDKAILDFRYWMDEPGNDSMWWFSENHAFLFHLCQYAAGLLYPQEIFTASGRTGLQQAELGKQRVIDWFGSFKEYGICEWNSATYIPIDLLGLFSLRLLNEDKQILKETDNALDFIFKLIEINSFKGIMSSSFGRAYEDTVKYRFQVEPCFIHWVATGEGELTRGTRSVAMYCLTDYEAPDFRLPKVSGGWEIKLAQAKEQVNTYNFITDNYSLSSVQAFRPFTHGHQQHLMNVALGNHPIQFFINHPGERVLSGQNRPSYWAGNGTMPLIYQKWNCALMLFDIQEEELVQAIHAYAPLNLFDFWEKKGKWAFLRSNDAYLGVYFSEDFYLTSQGPNTNREFVSNGSRHAVVVRLSDSKEYRNFEAFEEAMLLAPANFDLASHSLTFEDPFSGLLDVNSFKESYPRCFEINSVPITVDPALVKTKMELTLAAFRTVLYKRDEVFMENMKTRNLAGDDIKRYRFWEWPQGVGLFAIYRLFESTGEKRYLDILTSFFDQRIKEGLPAKNINTMAPILSLCCVAAVTGNAKYRAVCEEWAQWAMNNLARTEEGGFQHITSDSENHNELWDDTLFMTVSSLASAGVLLGKPEFIEEATKQTLIHIKHLRDPKTGLWFHGYTFDGNHNFSKALWGRGNCWITIALPYLLQIKGFAKRKEDRTLIETCLKEQIDALCACQDPSGMWHTLLLDKDSYLESSATCGFGYGLLLAYSSGLASENALKAAKAAIEPIVERIDNHGIVADVSYGTPMGRTDQDFYKKIPLESTPYGQALALLYLAKAIHLK